jgi:hypothetical protein
MRIRLPAAFYRTLHLALVLLITAGCIIHQEKFHVAYPAMNSNSNSNISITVATTTPNFKD